MGNICSKKEIGYYSYAVRIIRFLVSVPITISATMLSRLSRFYNDKKKIEFQNLINKILVAICLIMIPCVVGIMLCADNIVIILYGSEFGDTILLSRILSPIIFITSISYLCGSVVLVAMNKEKYILYATIVGSCLNTLLNAILIPIYHGKGAAVASVITELIVFTIGYFVSKKYVRYYFFSSENVRTVISAFVMMVIVFILKKNINRPMLSFCLSALGGASTYFVVLYVCKHSTIIYMINKFKLKTCCSAL